MSELARRLNQCRKPNGNMGKLVVDDMNNNHYELTGWGLNTVKIEPSYNILDIGCGGGITVNRLAKMASYGKVYGIDYSDDCVRWASEYNDELIKKAKVYIMKGTAEELNFEANKFDVVTAVETIYFWPNITSCFEEVFRVLKTGGKFLIINELYESEKFKDRNDELVKLSNMKIYSCEQLEKLLKAAGFKNIDITTVEDKNWIRIISSKN